MTQPQAVSDGVHPNLAVLERLNLENLDASEAIFADGFVWHYFNPHFPALHGDHHGLDGLKCFFTELGAKSKGSFRVEVVDTHTAGDELVVTQVCNRMQLHGSALEFDALVVWRIVNGIITEAWDIPAVNTMRAIEGDLGPGNQDPLDVHHSTSQEHNR